MQIKSEPQNVKVGFSYKLLVLSPVEIPQS